MAGKQSEQAKPWTFDEVLEEELEQIRLGRQLRGSPGGVPAEGAALSRAHRSHLTGLAFSGGGIRSATFNLGVLQALAHLGLLRMFDYLSTVSGGGYIGGWFEAWVKRDGFDQVERDLRQSAREDATRGTEAEPVRWLRRFSNYLTPRLGLLSSDTAAFVATYLRNTVLNLLILISALSAVLLLPRLLGLLIAESGVVRWQFLLVLAAACLLLAVFRLGRSLEPLTDRPEDAGGQVWVVGWVVVPLFVAAYLLSAILYRGRGAVMPGEWRDWVGISAVLYLIGWLLQAIRMSLAGRPGSAAPEEKGAAAATCGQRRISWLAVLSSAIPAGAVGGLLLYGIRTFTAGLTGPDGLWYAVSFTPALLIAAFAGAVVTHIGLTGRGLPESEREWFSRLGGLMLTGVVVWVALFVFSLYIPRLILWLHAEFSFWSTGGLGIAWILSTIQGLYAGRSPRTGNVQEEKQRSPLEPLAAVAPTIFVAGLLGILGLGIHILLQTVHGDPDTLQTYWERVNEVTRPYLAFYLLGFVALAAILAARVDLNGFSLHYLYEKRLVRCYLGASRGQKRRQHPFTGFDPNDDLPLADLRITIPSNTPHYAGPYPIVNTAINLTSVGKNELAWQERKALSFIFTPVASGFENPMGAKDGTPGACGYRPTSGYAGGTCLGAAVAISGAAASPNMGYHTSSAIAFLLTVFNVRLGWWLGNPLRHTWQRPGPRFGLMYLFNELLGRTSDRANFVYLSDGGHFENLGVYELIRRRCRFVVACDAEQDGLFQFNGLGNLIRKCRADFGIDIEIDFDQIRKGGFERQSQWHCAIGTIHYEQADPLAMPGTLLYLKSSMTGDEPSDVRNYSLEHPVFPHQSTGDQWFTESQFESYRSLGFHVARSVLQPALRAMQLRDGPGGVNQEELLVRLRQTWYPPNDAVAACFTKHGEEVSRLYEQLRSDPHLQFLDAHFYPEWPQVLAQTAPPQQPPLSLWLPSDPDELRAGFYFSAALLQLMENVYIDLQLDHDAAHPDTRGWVNLFRHWSWSSMVQLTWAIAAGTYGARFQTFCEREFGLAPGAIVIEPLFESSEPVSYETLAALLRTAEQQARINFLERELLLEVAHANPEFLGSGVAAYALRKALRNRLVARDPRRTAQQEEEIRLTFGVAMTAGTDLVYFRIQDHLRRMGLGRAALRALMTERAVAGLVDPVIPKDSREPVDLESFRRFSSLFGSVRIEMQPESVRKGTGTGA